MATTRIKRHAPDELEGEQRLAKRFDLLNLCNEGKLYIPVPSSSAVNSASTQPPRSTRSPRNNTNASDHMQVEDTANRVYIHDLSAELEDASSDDEHPIFLPDIEKHLLKIPKYVLVDDQGQKAREDMQLVLYTEPKSLTVPENWDGVRRAVRESRQRTRDLQPFTVPDVPERGHGSLERRDDSAKVELDPDAMDIG